MTVVGAAAGTAACAKGMARLPRVLMCLALPEGHRLTSTGWLPLEGNQAWMAVPEAQEAAQVGPTARTRVQKQSPHRPAPPMSAECQEVWLRVA